MFFPRIENDLEDMSRDLHFRVARLWQFDNKCRRAEYIVNDVKC
jgi:hypothetical protein